MKLQCSADSECLLLETLRTSKRSFDLHLQYSRYIHDTWRYSTINVGQQPYVGASKIRCQYKILRKSSKACWSRLSSYLDFIYALLSHWPSSCNILGWLYVCHRDLDGRVLFPNSSLNLPLAGGIYNTLLQYKRTTSESSTTDLMIAAINLPQGLVLAFFCLSFSCSNFFHPNDDFLAVLMRRLQLRQTKTLPPNLSPHIAVQPCGLLLVVASSRDLSLLLIATEPQLSFRHFVELTSASEFFQIRVASVEVVNEAMLETLSFHPSAEVSSWRSCSCAILGPSFQAISLRLRI